MLEIILVFYLARTVGNIVEAKGYPAGKWKGYVWLAWFGSEIGIGLIGLLLLGLGSVWVYIAAIVGAFVGYFIVRQKAQQLPDNLSQDLYENLGRQ